MVAAGGNFPVQLKWPNQAMEPTGKAGGSLLRRNLNDQGSVFTWLDEVCARPSMHIRSLRDLESQIHGYYRALDNHRVIEPVPQMHHHFLIWVHHRTGWSTCSGWAYAIESRYPALEKQLTEFFALVTRYRRLRAKVRCAVSLSEHHQPTGRRVVIGSNERMERPDRVEIVRYQPEPLHFLRFHYPDKTIDGWLLMKPDGTHVTTILDAKKWVRDELQVKGAEWERIT